MGVGEGLLLRREGSLFIETMMMIDVLIPFFLLWFSIFGEGCWACWACWNDVSLYVMLFIYNVM